MSPEALILIPIAATLAVGGSAGFFLHRRLRRRRIERVEKLRAERARLEAAVSEMLGRVNEIDLACKYQDNQFVSLRLGDICVALGNLADNVSAVESQIEKSNVRLANKIILESLSQALRLSDEINDLRSKVR